MTIHPRLATALLLTVLTLPLSAQDLPAPMGKALEKLTTERRTEIDKRGAAAPLRVVVMSMTPDNTVDLSRRVLPEQVVGSVKAVRAMLRDAWLEHLDRAKPPDGTVQVAVLTDWRPAEKVDLRVEAVFKKLRLVNTRWTLVPASPDEKALSAVDLADDDAFRNAFSRHISVRSAWRRLVSLGARAPRVQTMEVAPDYILVLRPAGRTPMQRTDLEDDVAREANEFFGHYPEGSMMNLADIVREKFVVADNYSTWLGMDAGRVGKKQVGAYVMVDYGRFIKMTVNHLADTPFKVGGDGTSVSVSDEAEGIAVHIRLSEAMLKTAYAGLTQTQGLRRYVCAPIASLPKRVALKRAVAARVAPRYTTRVAGGRHLEFVNTRTRKPVRRMVDLSEAVRSVPDPADKAALEAFLKRAASFDAEQNVFVERDLEPGKGNVPVKLVFDPRDARLLAMLGHVVSVDETFGYGYFLQYPDELVPLRTDRCKLAPAELDRLVAEALPKVSVKIDVIDSIDIGAQACPVAVGQHLSRVWTDSRLARNLLEAVTERGKKLPRRVSLFVVSDNVVVFAPRHFDAEAAETASARAIAVARSRGLAPGSSLFAWRSLRLPRKGVGTFEVKAP